MLWGRFSAWLGMHAQGRARIKLPGQRHQPHRQLHHVYKRAQFETIWLRTKRINAKGKVSSGTGGVCYLYSPAKPSPGQRRALASVGVV